LLCAPGHVLAALESQALAGHELAQSSSFGEVQRLYLRRIRLWRIRRRRVRANAGLQWCAERRLERLVERLCGLVQPAAFGVRRRHVRIHNDIRVLRILDLSVAVLEQRMNYGCRRYLGFAKTTWRGRCDRGNASSREPLTISTSMRLIPLHRKAV
jgi:hypothetical protein